MALRLRRGTDADRLLLNGLNNPLPAEGELLYTTDTKKLYVGDGTTAGGVAIDTGLVDLNSSSLGDLGDVDTSSLANIPANGEVLGWDALQARWEPTSIFVPTDVNQLNDADNLLGGFGVGGGAGVIEGSNYKINIVSDDSSLIVDIAANSINASGGVTTSTVDGDITSNNLSTFNGTVDFSNSVALLMPPAIIADEFIGNLTGNVSGQTNGLHVGAMDGDLTGSVFGDDSTMLVDGVNGAMNAPGGITGYLKGDVYGQDDGVIIDGLARTVNTNSIITSDNLIITAGGNLTVDREGLPVVVLSNNQPTADLSVGGTLQAVMLFQTIDTNGTNNSAAISASADGISVSTLDASYALPDSNKFFIAKDGKFGVGTITPNATLDVQGAIMPGVYADAAARDAAIPTPVAGMMVYVTDVAKHQGYNGAGWQDFY